MKYNLPLQVLAIAAAIVIVIEYLLCLAYGYSFAGALVYDVLITMMLTYTLIRMNYKKRQAQRTIIVEHKKRKKW